MNSDKGDVAFRKRLEFLIGGEEPYVWAKRIGIPSGTFARIWTEHTVPTAKHLRGIADATGVSLDWLILGRGEMYPGREQHGPPPDINEQLLGRITDAIERVYREEGIGLPRVDLGALAARKYKEIWAAMEPPELLGHENVQITVVNYMAAQLRKELQTAAAAPASSKRQASG